MELRVKLFNVSGNHISRFFPTIACMFSICLLTPSLPAQTPAFPGAEGYAKYVTGGRGGRVIEVTTLDDDVNNPPVGSLRAALADTSSQPRTIVFRVSGLIALKGRLDVGKNNITIAGQTAPGDGICLKNYPLKVYGKNIIIRYLRSRPGDETHSNSPAIYGIDVENAQNVIIDHCSFSWSIEEAATFYDNKYTTVQWCIISESLKNSFNSKGAHGYAGVWGGQFASYHHNLIAHNDSRNPRFNGARAHDTNAVVDYRNNVIYNWSNNSAYGGEIEIANGVSQINMINNYYKYGPATTSKKNRIIQIYDSAFVTKPGIVSRWYITGNYIDGDAAVTANNWNGGVQLYDIRYTTAMFKSDTALSNSGITTESAADALQSVLAGAGAFLPKRDSVDLRAVKDVTNRTALVKSGIIDSQTDVGGWQAYNSLPAPVDSDHDGIPDTWEVVHGLDPQNPADGALISDASGYSNLELYLNDLVAHGPQTGVRDLPLQHPEFQLHDNYPNPFNPSTMISYSVPVSGLVVLRIYNAVGKEICTLVNENKSAGSYSVTFSADNLPSGVYFYTIRAGAYSATKKMLLLK
jgi:hypothetical protein